MSVEVHNPAALVLLVFLPLVVFVSRRSLAGLPPVRAIVSTTIRCIIMTAVILALAELHMTREGDTLTTVFVVDQSKSIPSDWSLREVPRRINGIVKLADPKDRIGLVLFGADASIEKIPEPPPTPGDRWISGTSSIINADHTDIAGALRLARAIIPAGHMKRIVLFSEGNENMGVAIEEAERAKAAGVVIDVVTMDYTHSAEVLVEKVILPARLKIAEPFKLRVVVWAMQACKADLVLYQDGYQISTLKDDNAISLSKGTNVFTFPFAEGLLIGGTTTFKAVIRPEAGADSIAENNKGEGSTNVESGEPKILLIENDLEHARFIVAALREEKMDITAVDLRTMPESHKFAGYDCIILSNVPAGGMSKSQMRTIADCVTDLGTGLVWIGGEHSFGAGGWRGTPIERVSPISCDIKQQRVLPKGALVLIMDAAEVAEGNRWAIKMAAEAIQTLSSRDEIAIMSSGRWLVKLQLVGDHQRLLNEIERMQPTDVCDFDGMLKEAGRVLDKESTAAIKHIILMSDAGPGGWQPRRTFERVFKRRNITVSTVVYKDHFDGAARMMEQLASLCGGSYYHPQTINELPRIFVKEAALISRSLIHEEPFTPEFSPTDYSPIVKGFNGLPELGGYVLVTAKPDAEVPLIRTVKDKITNEEQQDPILAHRQDGLGRTVAFMSDAKNRWAPQWISWGGYGRFWAQTVRWALRTGPKGGIYTPTIINMGNGTGEVIVETRDKDGNPVPNLSMQGAVIRPGSEDEASVTTVLRLEQIGLGRWKARFDAKETGSYFIRIQYKGKDNEGKDVSGCPISSAVVAYSPEYRELDTNLSLLENIASVTGGRVLTPTDDVFDKNLPVPHTSSPAWDWMIIAALVAFPLDVFVRKVVIDRRQVAHALKKAASVLPIIGAKFRKTLLPADPEIARLLAKKREVREGMGTLDAAGQASAIATLRAVQAGKKEEAEAALASDADISRGLAAPQPADRPRTAPLRPPRSAATKTPDEDSATPYTQRLLQAKKRALKKKHRD